MSEFNSGDVVEVVDVYFFENIGCLGQSGVVLHTQDDMVYVRMDFDKGVRGFDDECLTLTDRKKPRGFSIVSTFVDQKPTLPTRKTKYSAGYDISIIEGATIEPGETHIFDTGIKAYMQNDEYLALHVRSSIGIKRGLILANATGIVDADYYDNHDNEGHIMIALRNTSNKIQEVKSGECVTQGIFQTYYVSDDDEVTKERKGGIGSTSREREKA